MVLSEYGQRNMNRAIVEITWKLTRNVVDSKTYRLADPASYASVDRVTWAATTNEARNATRIATGNATGNATSNATYDATYTATVTATNDAIKRLMQNE